MTKHSDGEFLASAVTVGAATTLDSNLVGGADFTSRQVDLTSAENIAITVETEGANAGIDGLIEVDLIVSVNDTPKYDTANVLSQVYATVACRATTNALERSSDIIAIEGFTFIGIGRIRNSDATYAADVQVYWGKNERI